MHTNTTLKIQIPIKKNNKKKPTHFPETSFNANPPRKKLENEKTQFKKPNSPEK